MTARGVHISGSFMGLILIMALAGPAPAVAVGVLAVVLDAIRTRPPAWALVIDAVTYACFPLIGGILFEALRASDVGQDPLAYALAVGAAFVGLNLLNFVLTTE